MTDEYVSQLHKKALDVVRLDTDLIPMIMKYLVSKIHGIHTVRLYVFFANNGEVKQILYYY